MKHIKATSENEVNSEEIVKNIIDVCNIDSTEVYQMYVVNQFN